MYIGRRRMYMTHIRRAYAHAHEPCIDVGRRRMGSLEAYALGALRVRPRARYAQLARASTEHAQAQRALLLFRATLLFRGVAQVACSSRREPGHTLFKTRARACPPPVRVRWLLLLHRPLVPSRPPSLALLPMHMRTNMLICTCPRSTLPKP